MTAIDVRDLVVRRGHPHVPVLRGISTQVPIGEITGLLGPSGSGKTTLIRSMVGVQQLYAGSVTVFGEPAGSASLRHRIGYLTQDPSVYPDLTVRENVRYFASLYRFGRGAADEIIELVGLAEQAGQLVGTLSGGQHSRASLACAMAGRGDLLVLDEPTVGQDPVLRDELWQEFREFAANGSTIVISSHVMDEAERCDRLLLIRQGEIIADDTPAGVKTAAGTDDLDDAFLTLIRARSQRQDGQHDDASEPSGPALSAAPQGPELDIRSGTARSPARPEDASPSTAAAATGSTSPTSSPAASSSAASSAASSAESAAGTSRRSTPRARPSRTPHLVTTTLRILRQVGHDHRTVALIVLVPPLFLTLVSFMFADDERAFQRAALVLLGIFPFVMMFLVTSIAMLRERTSGTLERLFTTPLGKLDLLFGYGIAFGVAAAVQAAVAAGVAYWLLGLETAGNAGLVILIAVANAVLGVAFGLFCSAFARTEFQAVQFMPVVAVPQILLCGLFVPREAMAGWLEAIGNVLPLTYAVEALREVGEHAEATSTMWRDLGIVSGVIVLALALAAATMRRRTP